MAHDRGMTNLNSTQSVARPHLGGDVSCQWHTPTRLHPELGLLTAGVHLQHDGQRRGGAEGGTRLLELVGQLSGEAGRGSGRE